LIPGEHDVEQIAVDFDIHDVRRRLGREISRLGVGKRVAGIRCAPVDRLLHTSFGSQFHTAFHQENVAFVAIAALEQRIARLQFLDRGFLREVRQVIGIEGVNRSELGQCFR
jgi:hypothetical protein